MNNDHIIKHSLFWLLMLQADWDAEGDVVTAAGRLVLLFSHLSERLL